MSQTAPAPADTPHKKGGNAGVFIALIPWIFFTVIAEHGTLKLASIASLVLAVGIAIYSSRDGGFKLLEVAAVGSFAVFTVLAFVVDQSVANFLTRYARAIAAALLAALCFGSLFFTPFTEQYARASVPKQFWNSPRFHAVNRRISKMWAGIFGVMTCSHIVAGAVDRPITNIVCNWAIPIALVLHGMKQSTAGDDAAPAQANTAI